MSTISDDYDLKMNSLFDRYERECVPKLAPGLRPGHPGSGAAAMSTVWSCGGGTQSAAIAAMIVRGDLPKPDAAVISDTGREASETWRYYENVLRPQLATVGVDLVRLPHTFIGKGWNTVDLVGGAKKDTLLPPFYTTHTKKPSKKKALSQKSKFCSNEWKARPIERYCRSIGLKGGTILIGFSVDEFQRMKGGTQKGKWIHSYPLVDAGMSRADCVGLVVSMGWPKPPRSSCWMCPYRTDAEWTHLKTVSPDDFERAQALELEVRVIDPTVFLHRSGKLIGDVQFSANDKSAEQQAGCESGHCFT